VQVQSPGDIGRLVADGALLQPVGEGAKHHRVGAADLQAPVQCGGGAARPPRRAVAAGPPSMAAWWAMRRRSSRVASLSHLGGVGDQPRVVVLLLARAASRWRLLLGPGGLGPCVRRLGRILRLGVARLRLRARPAGQEQGRKARRERGPSGPQSATRSRPGAPPGKSHRGSVGPRPLRRNGNQVRVTATSPGAATPGRGTPPR